LKNLSYPEKIKWTKEFSLCIHAELMELLEWTSWKHWSKKKKPLTQKRLKEIHIELVDIMHFLIDLCQVWGMDYKLFKSTFKIKHNENIRRQDDGY
jgi:hypothetical protein